MSDTPRGSYLWYDLMTTDPAGAKAFYTKVAGWGTEKWKGGIPDMPYDMWTTQNGPIGGVMQLPEAAAQAGAPPHWLAYIHTPDVDATVARAQQLGGTLLHPPMDLPEVGRFATLADPFGAVFAAFAPQGEGTAYDGMPRVGDISWNELMAGDLDKAWSFYSDLFGWTKGEAMDMGPMGIYQTFHTGQEHPMGGMMNKPPEVPVSAWMHYIRVDDVEAAVDRVKQNGGQLMHGPMEVPGGKVAACTDPQGAWFALHWVAEG
ncbi:MAG: VOC family protein [Gemmatimonadota bacterium]